MEQRLDCDGPRHSGVWTEQRDWRGGGEWQRLAEIWAISGPVGAAQPTCPLPQSPPPTPSHHPQKPKHCLLSRKGPGGRFQFWRRGCGGCQDGARVVWCWAGWVVVRWSSDPGLFTTPQPPPPPSSILLSPVQVTKQQLCVFSSNVIRTLDHPFKCLAQLSPSVFFKGWKKEDHSTGEKMEVLVPLFGPTRPGPARPRPSPMQFSFPPKNKRPGVRCVG